MPENPQSMSIGPAITRTLARGSCKECGGQCGEVECGIHPLGCLYGGFGEKYFLIAEGCELDHG